MKIDAGKSLVTQPLNHIWRDRLISPLSRFDHQPQLELVVTREQLARTTSVTWIAVCVVPVSRRLVHGRTAAFITLNFRFRQALRDGGG